MSQGDKMAKEHEEDMDFSGIVNRYSDMRRERDALRSQLTDVERSLAVSESKVERLETELEKAKAQFDSIKASIIEKETIIQGIGTIIITHLKKADITPAIGSPPKRLPQFELQPRTSEPFKSSEHIRAIGESLKTTFEKSGDGGEQGKHERE
jgi:hypothetical protein